jgi:hypothetical protein
MTMIPKTQYPMGKNFIRHGMMNFDAHGYFIGSVVIPTGIVGMIIFSLAVIPYTRYPIKNMLINI